MNTNVHARSVWLGLKQRFRPLFALFLAMLLLWTLCAPVAGTGAALREQWEQSAPAVTLEGDCGTVHVRVDAPAGAFPAGTEMCLTPAEGEQVNQAVERTVTRSVQAVEAVDIAFYDTTGAERQPERTVDVTLTDSAAPGGTPAVVHLAQDGGAALVDRITQTEQGVSFRADSFSIYAVVYTVDFYYGEYEYHMPGGETMLLSQIFVLLNTGLSAQRVTQAEFSDPTLVTLEQVEGDWLVHSLQPFDTEETLILTFDDGEQAEIRVTDEKVVTNHLWFNVNDYNGGCVFAPGPIYGEKIQSYMDSNHRSILEVSPRSTGDPTDESLSCNQGWRFVGWLQDGTEIFNGTQTIQPYGDPAFGRTFTACFAPQNQYMITFNKNVEGSGSVVQGGAVSYQYVAHEDSTDKNGNPIIINKWKDAYFCYSGDARGATAVPGNGWVFDGWYDGNNRICSTETFVPPANLNGDKIVTARFRQATNGYQITYQAVNFRNGDSNLKGQVQINGGWKSNTVSEGKQEGQLPSGAVADASGWANNQQFVFVCWRDEDNHILTMNTTLNSADLETVRGNRTYTAEYLRTGVKRVLMHSNSWQYGSIFFGGDNKTDDWCAIGDNNKAHFCNNYNEGIRFDNTVTAVPNAGYQFDHWELNGNNVSSERTIQRVEWGRNYSSDIQVLTAVFVPVYQVTYDLGVIRQAGINTPQEQTWVDVPWCREDKHMVGKDDVTTYLGNNRWAEMVNGGGTVTLPNLTAQTQVTQTIAGYNLLTHSFNGWFVDGDTSYTLHQPGETITVNGPMTLIASWHPYFPGKQGYYSETDTFKSGRYNTNTCGFFVRLFDNVFDKGNTNTYTDCLFTTRLILGGNGQLAQNDKNGNRLDYYGFSDAFEPDRIAAIDAGMRANANSGLTYWYDYDENPAWDAEKRTKMHNSKSDQDNTYASLCSNTTMRLELPFPSDEFIFGRIRLWNLSAPEERKITIGGHKIPQYMLTPDYFDLKWYVLKDQENSWHIDGMLVPKYAKLVVTKSFVGVPEAVNLARQGYSIRVTRQVRPGETPEAPLTLNLNQWSAGNPLGWRYIDQSNGQYVWVLDNLLPLQTYEVKEQNYTASGYTDTKTYRITNSPQTQNLSGASDTATVDKVYSYADSTSVDEIQTVSFTNLYTVPYVMTIMKQDGTTLHGLNGVTFDFMLLRNGEKIFSQACTSDANGQVAIQFNNNYYGDYDFTLKERAYEGYQALATITGQVNITANGKVTLSNVVTTVEGVNTTINPDSVDPSIIYLQNHPERQKVRVTKHWTDGTTTPVTVVLLCDGHVVGESVQLNRGNSWTYEWTDLPAYVDGHRVVYTVREEWIGPAGWPTSIHYNTANGADGYEEYIVSQSQTETVDEQGNRFSNVYIENTPDHGQVKFSKVNLRKQAVSGAQFTVYTDPACNHVATKWTAAQPNAQAVYTSNENGVVEIVGLAPGTYYVKETHAPSGYQVNNTVYKLTVKEHNSTITTLDNKPLTEVVNEDYKARIKVVKTKMGTNNRVPLAGAEFSLHSSILQNGQPVMVAKPMLGYEQMVSDENGVVVVKELQQGTYFLRELKAPEGYNALTEPIKLVVDSNTEHHVQTFSGGGNQTFAQDGEGNFVVYVQNNPGVSLPSTGGLGRERYMGAGTALVLTAGAALLLGRRRRKRTSSGHRAK